MKKIFTRIHLWLSIPVGLVISVVCFSGAALVFEKEIREWQNPSYYKVKVTGTPRLSPSELTARLQAQLPDSLVISQLQYPGAPEPTCQVSFSNLSRITLFADPYTGEIKGWQNSNTGFFASMRKLHRWLMDDYKRGEFSIGKTVVGISTLMLVFILISGAAIWIPLNHKALRHRLTISCTKGWRRFWYDSHIATGIYAGVFLIVMALTGLTWSFSWYRTAFYTLFGANTTSQQTTVHSHAGKGSRQSLSTGITFSPYETWDTVLSQLEERYPIYKTITLQERQAQVEPAPGAGIRRIDIAKFHPRTGEIKEIILYGEQPQAQKLKGWIYAVHTGLWGGIPAKILTFLAALIGGILPLSGYYLWTRKKIKKKKILQNTQPSRQNAGDLLSKASA